VSLDKLFHPKSVAVIGASRKKGQVGREVLTNLLESFDGDVFPVNPNAERIDGLKCYDNVTEVPGKSIWPLLPCQRVWFRTCSRSAPSPESRMPSWSVVGSKR